MMLENFIMMHAEISETLGLGLDHFPGLGLENTHFPGLSLSLEYSRFRLLRLYLFSLGLGLAC